MQQISMWCGRLAAPAGLQDECVPPSGRTAPLHTATTSSRGASLTTDTHVARETMRNKRLPFCATLLEPIGDANAVASTHERQCRAMSAHPHRRHIQSYFAMLCHPSVGCCCVQQYLSMHRPLHLINCLYAKHTCKNSHMPVYQVQSTHRYLQASL
jgi:hypothetical protein